MIAVLHLLQLHLLSWRLTGARSPSALLCRSLGTASSGCLPLAKVVLSDYYSLSLNSVLMVCLCLTAACHAIDAADSDVNLV